MPSEQMEALTARFGKRYCATAATAGEMLTAALRDWGSSGREVIVPDHGCHSVAAAVVRAGAVPVFVGVGETLTLEADDVESALSSRTAAVIAVDQYGLPADYTGIRAALPRDVTLVADISQSWDSRRDEVRSGTLADAILISFGAGKPLSLGAGGAMLTDIEVGGIENGSLSDRTAPRVASAARFPLPLLDCLDDAIERADRAVRHRRRRVEELRRLLERSGGTVLHPDAGSDPSWTRVPLQLDATAFSIDALSAYGRTHFPHEVPVSMLPMFATRPHRRIRNRRPGADRVLLLKLDPKGPL